MPEKVKHEFFVSVPFSITREDAIKIIKDSGFVEMDPQPGVPKLLEGRFVFFEKDGVELMMPATDEEGAEMYIHHSLAKLFGCTFSPRGLPDMWKHTPISLRKKLVNDWVNGDWKVEQ